MKSEGFPIDGSALSALMLCYADNSLFLEAQAIWDQILNSSFVPNIQIVSQLFNAYGRMGQFDEVIRILHQVSMRHSSLLPEIYLVALSFFGKQGQLEMMENTLRDMISRGFSIDSASANAFLMYCSIFGSLAEMETAYARLKRRNVGNLLWNLLLLSYAANFNMKSLQREFLRMVESGFNPDLMTFNIRSLAFSKMSLFWDLHVSLEHMKHEKVVPDLLTYGCVVDAYLDRRVGMNLDFALSKMNVHDSVRVATDPVVFEVLGKGDFHSSSESFLEFKKWKNWTYRKLIATYLKKKCRSSQIFWNY
ncbi:hypothetical protein Vadar_019580 [Vaccinium darrowii]|uniref:Uncharacterized protein n=1 Tax=Vaccinium darrowii TaxID=229202 RepID=A0ACB7Y830_9ERIC|nr:hypothetical protein Vadar_019580 [Vaccinium darrowii]